ncbi:hypothetical protein Bca4012_053966 [Brassica carinata]
MPQYVDIKRAKPKRTGRESSFISYIVEYDQDDIVMVGIEKANEENNMYSGNGDYSGFGVYDVYIILNVAYTFVPSNLMVHP